MQTNVIYYSTMVLTLLLVNHDVQGRQGEVVRRRRSSGNNGTQTDWENEFIADLREVRQWICGTPKPRLVYWDEAIDQPPPSIPPSERLLLNVTVMHRCDACLGYCTNDAVTGLPRTCQAVEKERVTKTFKSVSMNSRNPASNYYRITFYNHTRCGCA